MVPSADGKMVPEGSGTNNGPNSLLPDLGLLLREKRVGPSFVAPLGHQWDIITRSDTLAKLESSLTNFFTKSLSL